MKLSQSDVLIVGAGAAGLMCAMEAGRRGRHVVVLDHAGKAAEKVRISGGGRCNFTNLHTSPENFLSANPRYCISALSRFTPADFVTLVEKHGIAYHDKGHGQLFCDGLSQQIVHLLLEECRGANVSLHLGILIESVSTCGNGFCLRTSAGDFSSLSLVVASGGLSIPKMGATNLGYRIARQFGLPLIPTAPALVPFTMPESHLKIWQPLAGVAAPAAVQCGRRRFQEGVLFTHRGLSGPAILQISSYWNDGQSLQVDLAPGHDVRTFLLEGKAAHPRQDAGNFLQNLLPKRLAQHLAGQHLRDSKDSRLADIPNTSLISLASAIQEWQFVPNGTEGYRTAEVTRGGVDTQALSSKTMESRSVPGLYFIGEVVDVTGQLGGFNFQWAWASGYVAGQYA